ncbi:MAG: peptidoglycan-binding protein [Mesorhizobium sp.]|nr:peptidoglycan-binding protein [Mesorhizobium sp.]
MRQSSASRDGAGFGGRRVLAGGGTALAVIFTFVAANAIWYQPHAHRSPILSTRAVQLPQPAVPSTEPGAVRDREIASREEDEVQTTVIRLEPEQPAPAAGVPLVADIQRVIAELGLYGGEIDGLAGPMTRSAIEAYQNMIGVQVTGQIDEELVAKLGIAGETAVPVPPTDRPDREQAEQAERPATDSVQTASLGDEIGDALVMRVQAALRAFGNDDIEIDGVVGPRTSAAIREFQSLFGLPETGDPDREVYAKMREIGLAD